MKGEAQKQKEEEMRDCKPKETGKQYRPPGGTALSKSNMRATTRDTSGRDNPSSCLAWAIKRSETARPSNASKRIEKFIRDDAQRKKEMKYIHLSRFYTIEVETVWFLPITRTLGFTRQIDNRINIYAGRATDEGICVKAQPSLTEVHDPGCGRFLGTTGNEQE
jgi:hypothetical protein